MNKDKNITAENCYKETILIKQSCNDKLVFEDRQNCIENILKATKKGSFSTACFINECENLSFFKSRGFKLEEVDPLNSTQVNYYLSWNLS